MDEDSADNFGTVKEAVVEKKPEPTKKSGALSSLVNISFKHRRQPFSH